MICSVAVLASTSEIPLRAMGEKQIQAIELTRQFLFDCWNSANLVFYVDEGCM